MPMDLAPGLQVLAFDVNQVKAVRCNAKAPSVCRLHAGFWFGGLPALDIALVPRTWRVH
jgi:hypothetical protein